MKIIREINRSDNGIDYILSLIFNDGLFYIQRKNLRNKIINKVYVCEIDGETVRINEYYGNIILDSIYENEKTYSDSFIINMKEIKDINWDVTKNEDIYTSTGIKFWFHKEQINSYRNGTGKTIISTHISPEGRCNLKCSYCSVTYRSDKSRIKLETIKDYVLKLKTRGLKSVIITGGGEPTLYPEINDLIRWIRFEQNLKVSLITNGTNFDKINKDIFKLLSWIRISINFFEDWENRIGNNFCKSYLSNDCDLGMSFIYTLEQEGKGDELLDIKSTFKKIQILCDKIGSKYIRIAPNCLLSQKELIYQHKKIESILEEVGDERFMHQHKTHNTPSSNVCHQAYFRPFLSEETWDDGVPGSVYPCDSVVLNDSSTFFSKIYQICKPSDILDFIDGKIKMKFNPILSCHECVFSNNVNNLNNWKENGIINKIYKNNEEINHVEFV